jgi:Cof subfamily protein (haloacid dehalogenase superfamily)
LKKKGETYDNSVKKNRENRRLTSVESRILIANGSRKSQGNPAAACNPLGTGGVPCGELNPEPERATRRFSGRGTVFEARELLNTGRKRILCCKHWTLMERSAGRTAPYEGGFIPRREEVFPESMPGRARNRIQRTESMSYRLVYLDVDGTLLTPEREITPATQSVLRRVREAGVLVGLATGRKYDSAVPYARAASAEAPMILYNGGRVQTRDDRRVLFRKDLPIRYARRALSMLRAFDIQCNLYIDDSLYVEEITPGLRESMEKDNVRAEAVGDLFRVLDRDPAKLLLIGQGVELERFRAAYLQDEEAPPHLVRSEPTYLEILPPGVNKGDALRRVCRLLDIPLQQTLAVGDSFNDVEMLEAAGLGVAMGNGPAEVRRRADCVTGSNEKDGVAQALERYVLGGG